MVAKKEQAKINFSWTPFWVAGWLFTLGYTLADFEGVEWWVTVPMIIISYFAWPLFLGNSIR